MNTLYILLWSTLLTVLLIASVMDWRNGIISNWLVLMGAVFGIAEHTTFQGIHGLILSLLGGAVWLLAGFMLWQTAKIGGGDVKLFAMIAVYTGLSGPPVVLMGALWIQMIIYLIQFARGHMSMRKPFAPAIAMGSIGLMVWQMVSLKGGI